LGRAYVELDEWDRASEAFQCLSAADERGGFPLMLCALLRAQGDYSGALRCCERALADHPNHAEAYLHLGLTYRSLRLWDEAAGAYEKAIELGPNNPGPVGELAFVRFRQGDLAAAETLARRALEHHYCGACVYVYLATTLEAQGRYREAKCEFKAALAVEPEDKYVACQYRKFRARQRKRRRGKSGVG
jgi:eukaryotic-like serine/threonine-protein kinase